MIQPEAFSTREELIQIKQFKTIFGSLTEGAFAYDRQGNIMLINTAAVQMLGLSSSTECIGHPYQQYLHLFETNCGLRQPLSDETGPLMSIFRDDNGPTTQAEHLYLCRPDKQEFAVNIYCVPIFNSQHQPVWGICVVHCNSSKITKKHQLQQTLLSLLTALDKFYGLPKNAVSISEAMEFFSFDVSLIAQQIVDLIQQQLKRSFVQLLLLDPVKDRMRIVATSGFTWQQEQHRRNVLNSYPISAFLPAALATLLKSQGIVILPGESMPLPPGIRRDIQMPHTVLISPLLINGQLIGGFTIGQENEDYPSPDEIALVQAITTLIVLIIQQFHLTKKLIEMQTEERILREKNECMNTFLDLASHELRTPLTTVMGNVQLAQRRLQNWMQHHKDEGECHPISSVVNMLDIAIQGTRLQERMINDIIDDAQIQTQSLVLHCRSVDLRDVVRNVTQNFQQNMFERSLTLEMHTEDTPVMVNADEERLKRVISTYLVNALDYSMQDQSVKIELSIRDANAYVAVHDQGPGIPSEEQEHIWERFYRAKGLAVQHELDLSLGLGLYLCRAFIELQGGHVGLDSTPGHKSTFWFTLPIQHPQ